MSQHLNMILPAQRAWGN